MGSSTGRAEEPKSSSWSLYDPGLGLDLLDAK